MSTNGTSPTSTSASTHTAALEDVQYGRLFTVINDSRLSRCFWIASLTITLYDFLLTLGDEVTYIWKGRVTRTSFLFILNRYWPVANLIFDNIIFSWNQPSDKLCFIFYNWFVYSPLITHVTIGLTLILRIYAMYDCNKRILIVLCSLLVLEIISETIMVGFIAARLKTVHLPPPVIGCVPRGLVHWVWAYWVPMSIFESCLFLLAVLKAIRLMYCQGAGRAPDVLVLLLRDSVIYFGGVLAVILTNLIVWKAGRPSLFPTFPGTAFAVHSILGCRMLLNIQKAVYDPERRRSAIPLDTMDDIDPRASARTTTALDTIISVDPPEPVAVAFGSLVSVSTPDSETGTRVEIVEEQRMLVTRGVPAAPYPTVSFA